MNAIVVVDNNWGIGKDNQLLFRLPLDLGVNFKTKTMGKVVVMGANTYYSLPAKFRPLAERINIVLDSSDTTHEGAITVHTVQQLLDTLKAYRDEDIFIIGGASVYALMLPYCDKVYVTKVDGDGQATVFFHNLDCDDQWHCQHTSPIIVDNGWRTTYNIFTKK